MLEEIVDWLDTWGWDILTALLILALAGAMIWAIGQEDPELTEGVVVDKIYTPAHTETLRIWSGKAMVTRKRNVPEEYHIRVKGTAENGDAIEDTWSVSYGEYSWINIGDTVRRGDIDG